MALIEDDLYTVENLMERYGKSRATILRWARQKRIDSIKPGLTYMFTGQHIADFESGKAPATTEPTTDPKITEHLKRSRARRASNASKRAKAAATTK